MNRPAPEELISAYFDGELTPEERQQAENLLESSDELRQLLDDTSKLSALLHSFPRETAPAELAQAIQQRTEAIPHKPVAVATPKRASLRREWISFGAGALVTVATLLLVVGTLDKPTKTPSHFGSTATEPEQLLAQRHKSAEVSMLMDQKANSGVDKMVTDMPAGITAQFGESVVASDYAKLDQARDAAWADGVQDRGMKRAPEARRLLKANIVKNESQFSDEYLDNLKRGDLLVRQVVDANDAVAVVEFRVVDVDKAVDGIQVLLQKQHVQKIDDQNALGDLDVKAYPYFAHSLKEQEGVELNRNKFDDLVVLYARAPGDRLAEIIKESLKDHPEIYKSFEAQLPIGLPALAAAESPDGASQKLSENKSVDKDAAATVPVPSVSLEARYAIDSYATTNGLATGNSMGNNPQNAPAADSRLALRRNAETNNSAEGFTTWRVVAEQQGKSQVQENLGRVPQPQMAAAAKPGVAASPMAAAIPLQNSLGIQNNQFRFGVNRGTAEQRETRLVRMLIVLKPEAGLAKP